MRTALISAISSYSKRPLQSKARRFLRGLSSDELEYIAEFLGACVLEAAAHRAATRGELAENITDFGRTHGPCSAAPSQSLTDQDHKMILLLEYLCACGLAHATLAHPAESAR